MGELELIAAIERALAKRGGGLLRGPGDDAAVVRARGVAVTSIDTVAEGVHFERSTHSPADVGHKALAVALSDLAAMGARPGEAYAALTLPRGLSEAEALELVEGMEKLAERTGATIAGGDVIVANALAVTVSVTGWGGGPDELAYRDGAKPGDLIAVTGSLGGAAAGLMLLRGAAPPELPAPVRTALEDRHRRPEPRLEAGRELARAGATAMIDVSDGIATDAAHLSQRSGVAINIRLADLPLQQGVEETARPAGLDPLQLAAASGDDYELLLSAPPFRRTSIEEAAHRASTPLTWIGEATAGSGLRLEDPTGHPLTLHGHEHPTGV